MPRKPRIPDGRTGCILSTGRARLHSRVRQDRLGSSRTVWRKVFGRRQVFINHRLKPVLPSMNRSPTVALLTGLAVTLSAVAVYSGYTIFQLRGLRQLQSQTIDRDRTDSLLLLRIQNDLNSMALTIRDMLDANEPYPLAAWQGQCRRIRIDLDDAMAREAEVAAPFRDTHQPR